MIVANLYSQNGLDCVIPFFWWGLLRHLFLKSTEGITESYCHSFLATLLLFCFHGTADRVFFLADAMKMAEVHA